MTATTDPYRPPDVGLLRAVLAAPKDRFVVSVFADWFGDYSRVEEEAICRVGKIPTDEWTVRACRALAGATMLPGSWDKRFTKDVCEPVAEYWEWLAKPKGDGDERWNVFVMASPCDRMTPKQLLWVWRLVRKYRRQIRDKALPKRADELLTGIVEDDQ